MSEESLDKLSAAINKCEAAARLQLKPEASAVTMEERIAIFDRYYDNTLQGIDRMNERMAQEQAEVPTSSIDLSELVKNMTVPPPTVGLGDYAPFEEDQSQREAVAACQFPAPKQVPRADDAGKIHPDWDPVSVASVV